MGVILIVDDQSAVRTALEVLFEVHDLTAESVPGPREAVARVRRGGVSLVLQDMNFSANTTTGEEGIALFRQLHAMDPKLPVLLLTAWSSLETAVMLVKEGAADYLQKPWDDQKLLATVQQLLRIQALEEENEALRRSRLRSRAELTERFDLRDVVYVSEAMHEVVKLASQVARADVPVLITGPNGSGKEKIAEIVQANSRRRDKPFVKVNAGALPDALLESELFGAEAGAYTGAGKQRVGRFEAADGGTLFLDEVGNLSLSGQMKLLRVLQTGVFQRLGSNVDRRVDVRVISATNADLQVAIQEKTFREDLYFRLNVIELRVPALRERPEDVVPLAEHLLGELASSGQTEAATLSDEAREALSSYGWPGNVRELQNRMKRAVLLCRDGVIRKGDLGLDVSLEPSPSVRREPSAYPPPPASVEHAPENPSRPEAPRPEGAASEPREVPTRAEGDAVDRAMIEAALIRAEGKIARAAAELGLSRQALYRRMDRLGISVERRLKGSGRGE